MSSEISACAAVILEQSFSTKLTLSLVVIFTGILLKIGDA